MFLPEIPGAVRDLTYPDLDLILEFEQRTDILDLPLEERTIACALGIPSVDYQPFATACLGVSG